MMQRIIILTISIIISLQCEARAFIYETFQVRPVQLKIVEKTSGAPIPGIPVYYVLRSYWANRVLLVLPNPEGTNKRVYKDIEQYISNAQGEVSIPGRDISLRRWKSEEMYDEQIFINIDKTRFIENLEERMILLEGVCALGRDGYYNPVSKYKGFYIRSSTWDLDPEKKGKTKFEITDALWNSNGLLKKEPETFVIELERWDSQEKTPQK